MPMPRSQTDQPISQAARSVDNLALDTNFQYQPLVTGSHTSAPFNTERRKSKSEQHSPRLGPTQQVYAGMADNKFNTIDFSALSQTQTNQSIQSTMSDSFGISSYETMSGIADSEGNWSFVPSADPSRMPNNNYFGVWPTPIDNSNVGQPALTAASSGTTSEIDEMLEMEDPYGMMMPCIQEDGDFGGFSSLPTGFSPQTNRRSLPPSFFGNSDLAIPGAHSELQTSMEGFSASAENKSRTQSNNLSTSYDQTWPMATGGPLPSLAERTFGGPPSGSRPTSRSVGHIHAPGEDIIAQLFPDIDCNDINNGGYKMMTGPQNSAPTSSPVNFSPMDQDVGFTSQPFSDGSLSIPNDNFPSSYDIDEEFTSQDFPANWPQ